MMMNALPNLWPDGGPSAGSPKLPRKEAALLALIVSVENRCASGIAEHSELLRAITGDPWWVERVAANHQRTVLSLRDRALVAFAVKVTRASDAVTPTDLDPLRALGLNEDELVEAVTVIAYANFTNRVANSLGKLPAGPMEEPIVGTPWSARSPDPR
jgi:uncharacterized peroxidase-related enzyme